MSKRYIEIVQDYFLTRQETIAVAESVSSGMLQTELSAAPEAAKFFQGGITAYNIGQKSRHLKINPIHAINCNCVSPIVAAEMAMNVCELFSSHWGIGVTGYSSPVPESGNQLYAFYAIAYNCQIVLSSQLIPSQKRESSQIQLYYTREILKLFSIHLQNTSL
jgi:nicotinamide-nucleotide amidase